MKKEEIFNKLYSSFPKLVLVSASKNRYDLLKEAGCEIIQIPMDIDEETNLIDKREIVKDIAKQKLDAYLASKKFIKELPAIACDTMVLFNDELIGKAIDRMDAFNTIKSFSGKTQSVYSGVAIYNPKTGVKYMLSESVVEFNNLTDEDVQAYIDTGEWIGAAGSYRYQKTGYTLIKKIKGDWMNVIGLPLNDIYNLLIE